MHKLILLIKIFINNLVQIPFKQNIQKASQMAKEPKGERRRIGRRRHKRIQRSKRKRNKITKRQKINLQIGKGQLKLWVQDKFGLNKAGKGPEGQSELIKKLIQRFIVGQHLKCSICLELMVKPSLTICGHYYCQSCLSQSLLYTKRCANCRNPLNLDHIKHSAVAEQIICEVYLKRLSLNDTVEYRVRLEEAEMKNTILQNLQSQKVIDFFDGKSWRSGIIVLVKKIGFNEEMSRVVLLELQRLELLTKRVSKDEFRVCTFVHLGVVSSLNPLAFLEANEREKNLLIGKIAEYWEFVERFLVSHQQQSSVQVYKQYWMVRYRREMLMRELGLIRYMCFVAQKQQSHQTRSSEPSQNPRLTLHFNILNREESRWILSQLASYGESRQIKDQEQELEELAHQINSMNLGEPNPEDEEMENSLSMGSERGESDDERLIQFFSEPPLSPYFAEGPFPDLQ